MRLLEEGQAGKDTFRVLKDKRHEILLIAMANPHVGLRYGSQPFMQDGNIDILDEISGLCNVYVMPEFNMDVIVDI